jgi:hypothetical protein
LSIRQRCQRAFELAGLLDRWREDTQALIDFDAHTVE